MGPARAAWPPDAGSAPLPGLHLVRRGPRTVRGHCKEDDRHGHHTAGPRGNPQEQRRPASAGDPQGVQHQGPPDPGHQARRLDPGHLQRHQHEGRAGEDRPRQRLRRGDRPVRQLHDRQEQQGREDWPHPQGQGRQEPQGQGRQPAALRRDLRRGAERVLHQGPRGRPERARRHPVQDQRDLQGRQGRHRRGRRRPGRPGQGRPRGPPPPDQPRPRGRPQDQRPDPRAGAHRLLHRGQVQVRREAGRTRPQRVRPRPRGRRQGRPQGRRPDQGHLPGQARPALHQHARRQGREDRL